MGMPNDNHGEMLIYPTRLKNNYEDMLICSVQFWRIIMILMVVMLMIMVFIIITGLSPTTSYDIVDFVLLIFVFALPITSMRLYLSAVWRIA